MFTPQEAFARNKARALGHRLPRKKSSYVGVPVIFKLEMACHQISDAFCGGTFGDIYLVGSAIERPDWRDIDVVCILDDGDFAKLFPSVLKPEGYHAYFEHDPRWQMLTVLLSEWLSKQSGALVDFKFQPMTYANARHCGRRHCLTMRVSNK